MSELYHYGIQGQKWGVRRYQNEDGSYTDEGKKRYGVSSDGKMSKEGKRVYRADKKIDRAASKAKKNYDKSMELVNTRKEAKTRYGKRILGTMATDKHWKGEQQHIKANMLSQKYSRKFGYEQENKMMDDMSKTAFKSSQNFRPTTKGEKAASLAVSAVVTGGSIAAAIMGASPFYVVSLPRQSTYNYRIKDDDLKVKVKDLESSSNNSYGSGVSPYQIEKKNK